MELQVKNVIIINTGCKIQKVNMSLKKVLFWNLPRKWPVLCFASSSDADSEAETPLAE